jgi:uncharacterized membrane protein
MNNAINRAGALALGAGLMYLLDPRTGTRRRALLRDQIAHGINKSKDGLSATSRDVAHRSAGLAAGVTSRFKSAPVADDILTARVRAKLGRLVSHPHAIEVQSRDGRVTLRGPVLAREAGRLRGGVRRVRGVSEVIDELEVHDSAAGVPSLQEGGTPRRARRTWVQENWSPATRLLAAGAGAGCLAYGSGRRDAAGALLAIGGAGLFLRAITNLEFSRLTGVGAGRRAVEIQKTITVGAPVDAVYAIWERYEDFPQVMAYVREVRPARTPGQSHWVLGLPGGIPVEFDAEITRRVPNELIAWRSVEGSTVSHAGVVRFDPAADGGTRIHIRFSYNPPAGAIGHAVSALAGLDLKSVLDEELVRLKTFIERGRQAHDAAQRSADREAATRGTL